MSLVEQIERLGAELQFEAFCQCRVLYQSQVDIGHAGRRDSSTSVVAVGSQGGQGEGAGVEPPLRRLQLLPRRNNSSSAARRHAMNRVVAEARVHVGTIGGAGSVVLRVIESISDR